MIVLLWILIQIIGESLPISSSGHVQLMLRYFHISFQNFENFDFLLHGPTIIILLVCFLKVWWQLIFREDMDPRLREDEGKGNLIFSEHINTTSSSSSFFDMARSSKFLGEEWKQGENWKFNLKNRFQKWMKKNTNSPHPRVGGDPCLLYILKSLFSPARFIIIVDLITFCFWKLQLSKLFFMQHYFLPIGFFITMVCLYFSQYGTFDKKVSWSISDAIILGIVQGLCLLPGISRFAGTYAAGIWLGYTRKDSVALSFLIQFPLLCAAFLKELLMMYYQPEVLQNFVQSWMVFAIVFASLISYVMFCWVIKLIEQNRLWYFAFYMMVPMSLSLWLVKDVVI